MFSYLSLAGKKKIPRDRASEEKDVLINIVQNY